MDSLLTDNMCRLSVHNSSWRPPGRTQQQQNPPKQADRKINQSQHRNSSNYDISSDTQHSGKMRTTQSDSSENEIAPFLRNSSYHSYNKSGGSFKLLFVVFSMMLFILHFSAASAQLNTGHIGKELRVLSRNKLRWAARSSTTESPSSIDGDLDASDDRSFAYTERILFKPERGRVVNNGGASVTTSGQRSFSERLGNAAAITVKDNKPFSLPFGLRLKGNSNGVTRKGFAALQEEVIKPSNLRKRNFEASITTVLKNTSNGPGSNSNSSSNVDGKNKPVPAANQLSKASTKDDKTTTTTEQSTTQSSTSTESLEPSTTSANLEALSKELPSTTITTTTTKRLRSPTIRQRQTTTPSPDDLTSAARRVRNGVKARGRLRLRSSLPGFLRKTKTVGDTTAASGGSGGNSEKPSRIEDERRRIMNRRRNFNSKNNTTTTTTTTTEDNKNDVTSEKPVLSSVPKPVLSSVLLKPVVEVKEVERDTEKTVFQTSTASTTTTTFSSTSTNPSRQPPTSTTPQFTTTTGIVSLRGLTKNYKDIVRTTPNTVEINTPPSTTTVKTTTAVDLSTTKSTSTENPPKSKNVATENPGKSTTTTTTTAKAVESRGEVKSERSEEVKTSTSISTSLTSVSTSIVGSNGIPKIIKTTVENANNATDLVIDDNNDNVKDTSDLNVTSTTVRSPEILRPREDLQKDLLDAIRRKIQQNKVTTAEQENEATENFTQKIVENTTFKNIRRPSSLKPRISAALPSKEISTPSVTDKPRISAALPSKEISSIEKKNAPEVNLEVPKFLFKRPPIHRFNKNKQARKSDSLPPNEPRVTVFVNLPEGKPSPKFNPVNVSKIQDKIDRLNAAIQEGLKIQRKKEEEERIKEKIKAEAAAERHYEEELRKIHGTLEEVVEKIVEKESEIVIDITKQQGTMEYTTPKPLTSSTSKPKTTTTSQKPKTTASPSDNIYSTEHPSSHYRPATTIRNGPSTLPPKLPPNEAAENGGNARESGDKHHNHRHHEDFYPMPKSNSVTEGESSYVLSGSPESTRSSKPVNSTNTSSDKQTPEQEVLEEITNTTIYVVAVIALIPVVAILAWVGRTVIRRKILSGSELNSETGLHRPITEDDSLQVVGSRSYPAVTTSIPKHCFETIQEAPENIPKIDGDNTNRGIWEFPRSSLRLQTVLGEGNFGKVWKAEAENICGFPGTSLVAVKTVKDNGGKEAEDLVQEMDIMKEIGTHPNIVTLLGVCTEQEPLLLIMEYVMYGKLLTHLREQRAKQSSFFNFSKEADELPDTLTAKDLTKFAYGVAKGMEFLVSKGIIHRDLAARNILVDHNKLTKISDFGLSRNLRDIGSEMYEQKTKGALPIRWMAPESLYFSVFTPKSDVWGFGILMWEIVTLGSTPYPGMGAREVMRRVRDGYRLERPAHCHPQLYHLIQKCWSGDMNKRPDFSQLRKDLAKLLEDQHGYIDLQNISDTKYYSMDQNPDEEEKL